MTELTTEQREAYLAVKLDQTLAVKEAGTASFIQWCLKQTNGLSAFNPAVAEINSLAIGGLGSRKMDDDQKIVIMQKLEKAGVKLF